jgi:hypothetical protein
VRQALVPMRRCRNSLIGTAEQGTAKIQTTPRWQIHPSFATQSGVKRTLSQAANARRGVADCSEYRQAAGAVAEVIGT